MAGITITSVPDVGSGKVLSSNGNASTTYTPSVGIRASVLDATNPKYLRNITLDNNGVVIYLGPATTVTPVLVPLSAILALAVSVNNNLSWPPSFTTPALPVTNSVAYGQSTAFAVTVNSELSVTYQWQVSQNGGLSWVNLSNTGVYSTVTTATLNISSVTGLVGTGGPYLYRCQATNSLGTSTSNVGTLLIIDPGFTAQPANASVAHTNPQNFSVTAVGTATLLYAWQYLATGSGSTWTTITSGNATAAGAVTNYTTATMTATPGTTAFNGFQYRCVVTNGASPTVSNTSNAATMTVT